MNGGFPRIIHPEVAGVGASRLLLAAIDAVGERESRVSAEQVSEPGALVHHLATAAEPRLARNLDTHLPPRPVGLVHSAQFPEPSARHHPTGPNGTEYICNVALRLGPLLVTSPVLEVERLVKPRKVRPLALPNLPHEYLVEPGGVSMAGFAGRRRRPLIHAHATDPALPIEDVEVVHAWNRGRIRRKFTRAIRRNEFHVKPFVERAVSINFHHELALSESGSFVGCGSLSNRIRVVDERDARMQGDARFGPCPVENSDNLGVALDVGEGVLDGLRQPLFLPCGYEDAEVHLRIHGRSPLDQRTASHLLDSALAFLLVPNGSPGAVDDILLAEIGAV